MLIQSITPVRSLMCSLCSNNETWIFRSLLPNDIASIGFGFSSQYFDRYTHIICVMLIDLRWTVIQMKGKKREKIIIIIDWSSLRARLTFSRNTAFMSPDLLLSKSRQLNQIHHMTDWFRLWIMGSIDK